MVALKALFRLTTHPGQQFEILEKIGTARLV